MSKTTTVRMLVEMSGTRNGVSWPKIGGIIELPALEAAKYIANGTAEPADTKHSALTPRPRRPDPLLADWINR